VEVSTHSMQQIITLSSIQKFTGKKLRKHRRVKHTTLLNFKMLLGTDSSAVTCMQFTEVQKLLNFSLHQDNNSAIRKPTLILSQLCMLMKTLQNKPRKSQIFLLRLLELKERLPKDFSLHSNKL